MSSSKPNLTGFDPRKLAQSSGIPKNDPWARAEAWRYTGPFTRRNRLRGLFPGFGWGAGAFAVYLAYEAIFLRDTRNHHEEEGGHDKEQH
ncbi:MAG: hypothetical protein Q9159_006566 [Coniocarpon cinnabarinum]